MRNITCVMQLKQKIFNDPLYGLVRFPFDSIYEVIDHPYFQRLRRIRQLGLSSYVYTGATHSRFHHALGVAHLADKLVNSLKGKGVKITGLEHEGVVLAALLHDIGHGPFSHVLEHGFLEQSHEEISLEIMEMINEELGGKLDTAILIYQNRYEKPFLHQMISSQLDVDRLDYLNRDSYYTGVIEGKVGFERIIMMMNVHNNRLVIEEKGLYSIEKFILARRYMYMQVYLHKVVIILDEMLKSFLKRYQDIYINDQKKQNSLVKLLRLVKSGTKDRKEVLNFYLLLDDIDIFVVLKSELYSGDVVLSHLADAIINRKLFTIEISESPLKGDLEDELRQKVALKLDLTEELTNFFVRSGSFRNLTYGSFDEIEIITKAKSVVPISHILKTLNINLLEVKHFVCYPRFIE